MTKTRISRGRQTAYYLGSLMMVAGFLLAFLSFLPAFSLFGSVSGFVGGTVSSGARGRGPEPGAITGFMDQVQSRIFVTVGMALGGAALIVVGALVRRTGSHGLAGAGLVLDPGRARDDVKPWSEMQGGVIRDTMDAAGIDLGRGAGRPGAGAGAGAGAAMPFDEKLRRLHRLRQEGLISEEEYQRERKEVLDQN